jgi:glycosyltransferase involved in cell wall biosynthesis
VTTSVTIDIAGGQVGGAARYANEVYGYLRRASHDDIKVIGMQRRLGPAWLAIREAKAVRRSRRVALNNVGFFTPGGERWTLVANPLHFLTAAEMAAQVPALRSAMSRQIPVVHQAARRSDVLVAPSTAMAERIKTTLPDVADRVVVRLHPVSANPVSADPFARRTGQPRILCPVLFASYKNMTDRLAEWLASVDQTLDKSVRLLVTADAAEVPASLAANPRIELVGRLALGPLWELWARSQAVYFPSGLESFGFPLAEARVNGQPVIAQDTPINREIAGPALCGYQVGDPDSLRHATETALSMELAPDPAPFDPDAYFDWLLGKGA